VQSVLDDYRSASIPEALKATLGFLEKLTLAPESLTVDDYRPMRALGVSKEKIRDAIHIAALFNVYDRLADSLGWDVPAPEAFKSSAKHLLKNGYK
jgi:alkylhydroperoxidase family enzyme